MDEELKKELLKLGQAFEAFKAANDQRLAEITAKGSASADIVAKVEAANADITKIRTAIETIEANQRAVENTIARIETFGRQSRSERQQAEVEYARAFLAMAGQTLAATQEPSAEQLETYRAYRAQFEAHLRNGLLVDKGSGTSRVPAIQAALIGGVDPQGGYWLDPERTGRLVELVRETSPIRQYANVETTSKREVIGRSDLDEQQGYWGNEQTPPTPNGEAKIGEWKLPIHDLHAMPELSQDELEDVDFDVVGWLLKKVADILSRMENTAAVSGSGVGRWRGFLTYADGVPSATTWNVIEQTKTGVNGAFAAAPDGGDVFLTVVGKMKVAYRANARWAMNRTTEAAARKLKDSNGAYAWQPGLQAGAPAQLAGYPVALFEDMPVLGTGSLSIAFADFKQAIEIRDRRGISVLIDPFTNKPYVRYYTTRRSGGGVVNFEAIKLINFAA